MQRYVTFLFVVLCTLIRTIGSLEAQDNWPPGTELTYWYNSAGEPSGAGSEVRAAAGAWNSGIECYSFIEQSGLGIIQWITDEGEWDRGSTEPYAPGVAITTVGSCFYIRFNVAYYEADDWSTSCAPGEFDVKSIALHEFGHVLGLDHYVGSENSVMKAAYNMSIPDCWPGPYDVDKNAVNSFCANPAATVYAFSVSGGVARWIVTSEYETEGYIVEGAPAPTGPWCELAAVEPAIGDHAVAVVPHAWYRLLEVERGGGARNYGMAVDSPPAAPAETRRPTLDELYEAISTRRANLEASLEPSKVTAAGDALLIVTTEALADACSYGIADYWRLRGAEVTILTVDGFDPDPNVRRGEIHAAIANAAAGGIKSVLLVGDSNDHVQFDMEKEGPQWWPESWAAIHASYLTRGFPAGGQPEHDLVPAWYAPDTLPRRLNTAFTLPYVPYLSRYADVDGDGIPDLPWGCLPLQTAEQVLGYACKLWALYPSLSGAADVAFYVCDRDYQFVGDGAIGRAAAEAVEAALPSWVSRHRLYVTDVPDDGQRNAAAAQLWNFSYAGIHVLMGSFSNRYMPADFFDKAVATNPWHMGMLTSHNNYFPLVIANSCGGGDWARTEDPQVGTPVLQDFLAAHDRGALAWVGPSVGTWQHANAIFGKYLIEELYADPSRSMAASFLAAQRRMLEDPQLIPSAKLVALMMCYFGDPLASLNELAVLVSADPTPPLSAFALEQNFPNPFNPVTTIRYSIIRHGRVNLRIYNTSGQLVRTLVDEEQWPHEKGYVITWDGTNDSGRAVTSGVYFCRLSAQGMSQTKKVVVLR